MYCHKKEEEAFLLQWGIVVSLSAIMDEFLTPLTVRKRKQGEREREKVAVRVSCKLIEKHHDVQAQTSANLHSEEAGS